ncbi:MAG: hypothetical protein AAF748_03885 [Pseudomonadota bacterium]
MLKSIFSRRTDLDQMLDTSAKGPIGTMTAKYNAWRLDRDLDTIMATFYRLSNRHLAMIGIHSREDIYYRVAEMISQAEERKQIADDVARILDEPTETGVAPDLAARERARESGKARDADAEAIAA